MALLFLCLTLAPSALALVQVDYEVVCDSATEYYDTAALECISCTEGCNDDTGEPPHHAAPHRAAPHHTAPTAAAALPPPSRATTTATAAAAFRSRRPAASPPSPPPQTRHRQRVTATTTNEQTTPRTRCVTRSLISP